MANTSNQSFAQYRDERLLVSVFRDGIDEHSLYGFVICFSEDLVLVLQVDDFLIDGYLVFRRRDITSIKTSDTNRFQKQLLETEGVLAESDFEIAVPVASLEVLLRSLPQDEIVILEDEKSEEPDFLIGRVLSADSELISLRYLKGIAEWFDAPAEFATSRVTLCKLKSRYSSFYARHFERESQPGV